MNNKEVYTQLYKVYQFPKEFEEYLFPLFEQIVSSLSQRILENNVKKKSIDLNLCLRYLVEEHMYNMNLMNKEMIQKFMDFPQYSNHLFVFLHCYN